MTKEKVGGIGKGKEKDRFNIFSYKRMQNFINFDMIRIKVIG